MYWFSAVRRPIRNKHTLDLLPTFAVIAAEFIPSPAAATLLHHPALQAARALLLRGTGPSRLPKCLQQALSSIQISVVLSLGLFSFWLNKKVCKDVPLPCSVYHMPWWGRNILYRYVLPKVCVSLQLSAGQSEQQLFVVGYIFNASQGDLLEARKLPGFRVWPLHQLSLYFLCFIGLILFSQWLMLCICTPHFFTA